MANMKGFYTGDRWKRHVQSQLPKPKEPQCIHCGKPCKKDEGVVCNGCYSKYTPGMLADLDQ